MGAEGRGELWERKAEISRSQVTKAWGPMMGRGDFSKCKGWPLPCRVQGGALSSLT